MKLLVGILLVFGLIFAATVALPIVIVTAPFLLFVFIWFLPILIIACSDVTTGGEKLAWILAIIFLSWFAWIFYFLLAPIKKEPYYRGRRYRDYGDYRYY